MEGGCATRWAARIVCVVVACATICASGAEATSAAKGHGRSRPVTVMSRNLYLGADIRPALVAIVSNPDAVPEVLGGIWQDVQRTNIELRAQALAAEIADARPHVVGIQEAAVWRTQFPSDELGPNPTSAEDVVYDFLRSLRCELRRRRLRYRIAITATGGDIERATLRPDGMLEDVRMTVRDAILVRSGVRVRNRQGANYESALIIPFHDGPVPLLRQWVSVDVRIRGRTVRFVSTHLEDDVELLQALEVRELLDWPVATDMPVVVLGDLNSDPDAGHAPAPYYLLRAAGFADSWRHLHPNEPGRTWGHAPLLDNEEPNLTLRIDHVMTRGGISATSARVVGADVDDRIGGLWPSDHAGLVVDLVVEPAESR